MPTATSAAIDIPGWFFWLDRELFHTLLRAQRAMPPGDLVELGTYLGKSAVVIDEYVRPGERFITLDLFGRTDLQSAEHTPNRREVEMSHASLTPPGLRAAGILAGWVISSRGARRWCSSQAQAGPARPPSPCG